MITIDDLKQYSDSDIDELESMISRVRKSRAKAKVKEVQKQVEALAEQLGVSPADVVAGRVSKPAKTAKPKYADPDNPANTWTGRGNQPVWLREAIEAGKSLEDFAI
jgi:DNA-binding protein H-NS